MEKWIPEFFYDVIGRIGPGALLLVTALCAWLGPAHVWHEPERLTETATGMGWLYFGLAFLLSYFVGLIMSALWDSAASLIMSLATALTKPTEKKASRSPADEAKRMANWIEGKGSGPEAGFLSCYVSVHLSGQGVRLSKINAEESLCKTLITGFVLVFILALISPSTWSLADHSPASAYLIGAMAVSIFACWKWMGSLRNLYRHDLYSLGYLVATKQIPSLAATAKREPE